MANSLYNPGKDHILGEATQIDLDGDTIKVVGVTSSYTFSAAHEFRSSLSGNEVGTAATLTISITNGVVDAADLSPAFTGVSTDIDALVVFKDTGSAATSPLIAYFDTGTGFPLTQDGGNVDITWNGSGLFSI